MPTKCENCKKYYYSIYITLEYRKLCGKCYDKCEDKKECVFEPDDLPERLRRI